MSNYQSSFHVINLKLDIEPSLVYCRHSDVAQRAPQWPIAGRSTVERSDEHLCTGDMWSLP